MHTFFHINDLISEEQRAEMTTPFHFQFFFGSDGGVLHVYKKGDSLFGIWDYQGEYVGRMRDLPGVKAPKRGHYGVTMSTWFDTNPLHEERFMPAIFEANPIVLIWASNPVDLDIAYHAYQLASEVKDPMFVNEDDLNAYLNDRNWRRQTKEKVLALHARLPEELQRSRNNSVN